MEGGLGVWVGWWQGMTGTRRRGALRWPTHPPPCQPLPPSWLPLALGGRTLAPSTCPSASLFAVGAAGAAAATLLHAGGAPLAFAGWDDGDARLWGGAVAAHAAFALAVREG